VKATRGSTEDLLRQATALTGLMSGNGRSGGNGRAGSHGGSTRAR
jgi:hypothetical protein